MEEKENFKYEDSRHESHEVKIDPKTDFRFVQEDEMLTDAKIQTKPTTFFKDAIKRFAKNKSSVMGAYILGALLLLAFILPAALPQDIKTTHPYENKLAPKLFNAGTGWWDGTRKYKHIAIDVDWDEYESSGKVSGLPLGVEEKNIVNGKDGITMTKVGEETTDAYNACAHGGKIRLSCTEGSDNSAVMNSWTGASFDFTNDADDDTATLSNNYKIVINTESVSNISDFTYGSQSPYSISFVWNDMLDDTVTYSVPLATDVSDYGEKTFNLADYVNDIKTKNYSGLGGSAVTMNLTSLQKPHVEIKLSPLADDTSNLIFKKLVFSSTSTDADVQAMCSGMSITDANATIGMDSTDDYSWSTSGSQSLVNLFRADIVYGSYRLDTYEEALGNYYSTSIAKTSLSNWADRGWLTADFSYYDKISASLTEAENQVFADEFLDSIAISDEGKIHCPLVLDADNPISGTIDVRGGFVTFKISGTITRWKELYPDSNTCPRYLMGTDDSGKDLLKETFTGLRTSLLLGVLTFVVCFTFGLIWGSISGYFGGWTDIIMERFTDILSGMPWIVLMTLIIIQYGSTFGTFAAALCLTGWISTAALTRTQFYRFKDREYILASRTLGASDQRLIFRHILPNAIGTIITSSVLMIPSVIFSEATISYLNLGLQDMASLGVILSDNQKYVSTYPYLIVFPSVIMALIMISFNLFGNGLRDAFNPSLKGQE